MKGYRTSKWDEFRAEVIELDGHACRICKRAEPDVVLQVHHKRYIPGKQPWEYAYADCETLCKGCHAGEHGITPPKYGWKYAGHDDLGGLYGDCDLCGSSLRHRFFVHHKSWGTMQVGTYCCNALTDTEAASNHLESRKKYDDRKGRFIKSARWEVIGNNHFIKQKKIQIRIASTSSGYRISMNNYPGKQEFGSIEEAKTKVFEVIDSGKAEEFLALLVRTKKRCTPYELKSRFRIKHKPRYEDTS
ncbi:hypothetical protein MNBD_GAMMA26-60 [hydrothermal vent metagenome]|uniref:HNH domain-containing protein n=1 Tax=hydrothermal vent metagenome TaxID=652676 RepID=A0A3B1BZ73_9ZZZZ